MVGAIRTRTEAGGRPSVTVVQAVAAVEGCEPAELEVPLYEYVDPEALDALVASPIEGRITFTYHGYELTVDGDGIVTVDGYS